MNAIEQIKADYTLRRHEIINQGDFGQLIGVVRFAQAVHYFRTGEWVENYSILHHSFGGDRGLYGLIIETLCDLDGKEPPFTELTEKQIHAWHVHAGCDVTYARESQHFKFMDERLRAMRVPTSASDCFDNDEWFVSFHSELFDAVCDRIEREALAKLQPAPATTAGVSGKAWTKERVKAVLDYKKSHTWPETEKEFKVSRQRINNLKKTHLKTDPFTGLKGR